ncbi:hypothetical protein SCATT_12850 [Streptantibioticus cattleyicolor NRRL 8057 = DSM 46488]|uniref:Large membrane protein n=1 Tax=Streptantibioticus cattleyicolor (strain ATCC 35852 / DSM 46488 / JCM 4925 / NBRC 14057 / NRRL 8057) TaxID=1003195 RepID=G8WTL3_STREN|nr:hypothetical protein SCATT_12850 [Streptantibioticus cattleyicolor NRRL 8057 = DSM 46488]
MVAVAAGAVLLAGGGGAYWASQAARGVPPPAGPRTAPVVRAADRVPEDAVARLAGALGVSGAVTADHGLWRVGTGSRLLVGRAAPGAWTYSRNGSGCPPQDARSAAGAGAADPVCFAPPDAGAPRSVRPVSAAVAERAAAPVLAALGLRGAEVDASGTAGGVRTVTADPVVAGLPTRGWRTQLRVGPDGSVVSGSGRLAELVRGAAYPVRAAPSSARGARLGLAEQLVGGRPELVPSWLLPGKPGEGYPAVDPAGSATPVPVVSYAADGRTLLLRFWGGICARYDGTVVARSAGAVRVRVTASVPDPRRVCALLAKSMTVAVTLDRPLGGRTVYDASDGRAVAAGDGRG